MILTESDLRTAAGEARKHPTEFALLEEKMFDEAESYDLFISHSFKDKDLVIGLRYKFQQCGYSVYIDWIDDQNLDRGTVTPKTAEIIRNRLDHCNGLAYVATTNSTNSKWCPWELGLADGKIGRACILPIMSGRFNGNEYLGLYPYLEFAKTAKENRDEFWVYDQADRNRYIVLSSWLNGSNPRIHQ